MEDELELGRPVASGTTKNTESDGSGSTDESRSGGDGDESGDGARAETDDGPLALETPIPEHPGQSTDGGSQVGDDASLNGAQVGGESAAAVESEPSEPEHDRAENDVGGVVWLVRETLGAVAAALAEVERDGESGSSRRNVHTNGRGGRVQWSARATGWAGWKTSLKLNPTHGVPPAKSSPPMMNDQPLAFHVQQAIGS